MPHARAQRPAPRAILVLAAWKPELEFLERRIARRRLRVPVTTGAAGIGLVESALGAARLIAAHRPRAVILVGTAGLAPRWPGNFAIGAAAVVRRAVLSSTTAARGDATFPGRMPRRIACDRALRESIRRASGLREVAVACPLAIGRSAALAAAAARTTGCAIENLEVFSVARAAGAAGVPFAAVLGISNLIGPAGHTQWKRHARAAARAACDAIARWLESPASAAFTRGRTRNTRPRRAA